MAVREKPAELAAKGKPISFMRRWAYDGIDVMATKKAERPKGWFLHDVTKGAFFDDDVPLYANLNPEGESK